MQNRSPTKSTKGHITPVSYLQGKRHIETKLSTSLPSAFKIISISAIVLDNFQTWDAAQLVEYFLSLYKVLGSILNVHKLDIVAKA